MNRPLQRELFAQRPVRSDFARRRGGGDGDGPGFNPRKVMLLGLLVVVAILIGVGVNMMNSGDGGTLEEIPTIQAELPIKERPAQPGGIDIPHQDVAVFEKLDGKTEGAEKPKVEHLLPSPEVPKAVSAQEPTAYEAAPVPTAQPTESVAAASLPAPKNGDVRPGVEDDLPPAVTSALPEATPPTTIEPDPKNEVSPIKPEPVKTTAPEKKVESVKTQVAKTLEKTAKGSSVESQKADAALARLPKELFTQDDFVPAATNAVAPSKETATAVEKPVAAEPSPSGKSASIQLASVQDQAVAKAEAAKYQSKYAGVLGGSTLRVVRADLGSKGIYYRIMSSSMPESKAKAICSDITKLKKGSCLIVK